MQPHTTEASALLLLSRLLLRLELFSRNRSKAQEVVGQLVLVPKEWPGDTKGSLTTEGPEAAEGEASLGGALTAASRGGGRAPSHCQPLAEPFTQCQTAVQLHNQRPTDWAHLAWSSESARQAGCQVRSTEKRSEGKPSQISFQKPQSQSHLTYTPHSLGQGS